ncbi:hypothetical protein ACGF5O_22490 [Streptomyces sp. NPDC048291]|uniref:hypothetical protein n=1 Tax=Streptomyces sp. NPDC048291 TaxID=3365530 RepID=UPI00371768B7
MVLVAVFGVALLIAVLLSGLVILYGLCHRTHANPYPAAFPAEPAKFATLLISLAGAGFERREKLTAAWFGPMGFASVV